MSSVIDMIDITNKKHRFIIGKNSNNKTVIYTSSVITNKFFPLNYNNISEKYYNRVILSSLILLNNFIKFNYSLIGITESNIYNNIKIFFNNNDINNSLKIIFKKFNNKVYDSNNKSNNSLIQDDSFSNINYIDIKNDINGLNLFNINNNLQENLKQFYINFTISNRFDNTNYYNINFDSIFDNKKDIENLILRNITVYEDNNLYNDSFIKLDNLYILNFNEDSQKYLFEKYNNYKETNIYDISKNLFLYAKKNTNVIFDLSNISNLQDYSITFNIVDTNIKKTNIFFTRNNSRGGDFFKVLKINSYGINNKNIKLINKLNNIDSYSSKIFLSLGDGICGITQKSLYKMIDLDNNNNLIKFKNKHDYNFNNYLFDNSYNYYHANLFNYKYKKSIQKNEDINLLNTLQLDTSFNYSLQEDLSFTLANFNLDSYLNNNINIDFTIIKNGSPVYFEKNRLIFTIDNKIISINYNYNYNIQFTSLSKLYLKNINNSIYSLNPIFLYNNFTTQEAREYKNVNCIFTYYDPENEFTPVEFKYPNNNIKITTEPEIDTFSKAIELLPNRRTANTNSVFIPERNSSNLSRKHIQGLIGLNNVPRLLSIEPKNNDNFIIGRESTNIDTCLTNKEKIDIKIESTKYNKNKNNFNRVNLAKIISSRARLKNAITTKNSEKNINLSMINNNNCPIDYNKPITTPFTIYKTNRGKYM